MAERPAIKCLHLADLHLGWEPADLGGKEAERARERDGLLRKAVDFALDPANKIGLVVIAGDLFDSHHPTAKQVEETIAQLRRLETAGIPSVTTPGNHDEISYVDSVYRLHGDRWPGYLVSDPMPVRVTTVNVDGMAVHVYSLAYIGGVTHTRPPIREFPRSAAPGVHLAVFHGSLGWDGGDRSLPLEAEALGSAGYDYVALGHFHRFSSEESGHSTLVYAGPVEGRGFSDPGTGQFVVAEISPAAGDGGNAGQSAVKVRRIPVPGVRRYVTIDLDVTALPDAEALDHAMAEALDGAGAGDRAGGAAEAGNSGGAAVLSPLVRVELRGTAPFGINLEALAARHQDRCYYLEVRGEASVLAPAEIDQWATEPTLRGEFIRRVRRKEEEALASGDAVGATVARRALVQGLIALRGGAR